MRNEVVTNLLGRKARISLGMSKDKCQEYLDRTPVSDRRGTWAELNLTGEITALYMNGKELCSMIRLGDGSMTEVFVTHLSVEG